MCLPPPAFSRRLYLILALAQLLLPATVLAQMDSARADVPRGGLHWGPRFGMSYLSEGDVEQARSNGIGINNLVLQVGWSWEQRFIIGPGSPMPMTQFVFLVGGAEQAIFLPSLSWVIGIRGLSGGEIGFGPNVSLAGAGMVIAAGVSQQKGLLSIPVTLAAVIGKDGVRTSVLFGFNMQRERD
jgi:hypothetical protein